MCRDECWYCGYCDALMGLLVVSDAARYEFGDKCYGNPSRPAITATTYLEKHRALSKIYVHSTYGDNNSILCSADDTANLTISSDGKYLPAVDLNSTTILLSVKTLEVGGYTYTCRNNKTDSSCDEILRLIVKPKITVTSPHVRRGPAYFVPYGEAFEINCSGNEIGRDEKVGGGLIVNQALKKARENVKMISFTAVADNIGKRKYYCKNAAASLTSELYLIVDHHPEALNFQCIAYYGSGRIECGWDSSSKLNTFKLFFIKDNKEHILCVENSDESSRYCSWSNAHYRYYHEEMECLTLLTCNEVFCENRTFSFESVLLYNYIPPYGLKLVNESSRGVALEWRSGSVVNVEYEYSVKYRLLSMPWRVANTSSRHCFHYQPDFICEYQLALPCPNARYEVRVYQKDEDTPWSEPASMYVVTAQDTGEVDPECSELYGNIRPSEVVLEEIRLLVSEDREEGRGMKARLEAMNRKLDKIKELLGV